jgi:hypothetical protein
MMIVRDADDIVVGLAQAGRPTERAISSAEREPKKPAG